jgi:hypothetical protein
VITLSPIALFGTQFTVSLLAYALIGAWYVHPRLSRMAVPAALMPLLWVHAFRIVGGSILAPGAVDAAVAPEFRAMVGLGDMATAGLAILALIALRLRLRAAIGLVWIFLAVATLDTANAIVQSVRYDVVAHALGINWLIVTAYVPALLVSSFILLLQLLRTDRSAVPG